MYRRETREIVEPLLERICSIGDTCQHHKEDMNYRGFLKIQLELVKRIVETEKTISKLRKEKPEKSRDIREAIERRKLLRVLGTTIAWILLEFDRPYIRCLTHGHYSGFISGKKGLKLELLALRTGFKFKNSAAVLHDLTNCLLLGDLSITGPNGKLTLELKLKKRKKRNVREIRQKKRLEVVEEFYRKGISTKIVPNVAAIQRSSKKRDKHNFNELSSAIAAAEENGFGVQVVEKCLIYCAIKNKERLDEAISHMCDLYNLKDARIMLGCLDRHIDVPIPSIMPFTCFDIPARYKHDLLFRTTNFCVLLDLSSLCRIMVENGFRCRILENSESERSFNNAILEISNEKGANKPSYISSELISRLLYECLSVETFIDYQKTMDSIKMEFESQSPYSESPI